MLSSPTVNLIAVVGADGNIGPDNGVIVFTDPKLSREWSEWFMALIQGSTAIVGANTWALMRQSGFSGYCPGVEFMVWSRGIGVSPDGFLDEARAKGRTVNILGGAKTFEVFGPFVEMFILRRAEIASKKGHELPEFFKQRKLQ